MAKEDVCRCSQAKNWVSGRVKLVFRGDFLSGDFLPPAFFPTGNARKIVRMIGMFWKKPSKKWRSKSLVKANGILERTKLMENLFEKISCGVRKEDHPRTWKWFITLDRKSPITGVVGPLPNGLSWHINGGYQLLTNWDDPPSTVATVKRITNHCIF